MNNPEEIEAIAALVGNTNAHLKKVDEEIVSTSANLQHSQANWNPQEVLKNYIHEKGPGQAGAPVPPHVQSVAQEVVQHTPELHPPVQGSAVPAAVVSADTSKLESRLDNIEAQLSKLQITFDKILNGILKNKTKQITIKFDDTQLNK